MKEKKHSIKSDFSMLAILIIPIAVAVTSWAASWPAC